MQICLLDDSTQFREMMEEFLIDAGHDLIGFDKLPEEIVISELFFVDWNLGNMTAEESIKQIRNNNKNSHIWILTGSLIKPDLKKKMLDSGANKIINKPIDPDQLLDMINSVSCLKN